MVRAVVIILALVSLPMLANGQGLMLDTSASGGGSSLTTYDMSVVATNPTHYWTLADAVGSGVAQDFGVGTHYPLTATNVTFSSTVLGSDGATSASFNGTSSTLISGAAADVTGTYTSVAWMNCFTTTQTSYGRIFGPENTPGTTAAVLFDIDTTYVNNDHGIGVGYFSGSDKAVSSASPYNNGQVHCAGAVWTSGAGTITSVIDGFTIGIVSAGAPTISPASYYYKVGAGTGPNNTWPNGSATTGWGDSQFHYFNGKIAKVALWINTPITTSQLSTLETSFLGAGPPPLQPVSPAGGASILPTAFCNTGTTSTPTHANWVQLSTMMSGLGTNGELYIPSNCQVNVNSKNDGPITIPNKNITLACAGDGISGYYDQKGYNNFGPNYHLFTGNALAGLTINGCVWSNTYQPNLSSSPSGYYTNLLNVLNNGPTKDWWSFFNTGDNDVMTLFNSNNIVFTNNLVTHQFAGEGVLISHSTNTSVTNNVFVDNAMNNGLQPVDDVNFTFSGNYVQNTAIDFRDQNFSGSNPHTTGSMDHNKFVCTLDKTANATGTCSGALCPSTASTCGSAGNLSCKGPYNQFATGQIVPQRSTVCDTNYATYQPLYPCYISATCDNGGTGCDYSGVSVHDNYFIGSGEMIGWDNSANVKFNNGGGPPNTTNQYISGALNVCGVGGQVF